MKEINLSQLKKMNNKDLLAFAAEVGVDVDKMARAKSQDIMLAIMRTHSKKEGTMIVKGCLKNCQMAMGLCAPCQCLQSRGR